jgi:hypothetical protein
MLRILTIFAIAGSFAACTQCPEPVVESRADFLVPTTMILQTPDPAPSTLAIHVLPAANFDDFFVPRAEKIIYGQTPLSEISAYSVLTYDAQRIGGPRAPGYRYTWAVREGVFFP